MTRKKVQLSYIACDSARKSTFKKRKKGILKKIDELSILCGVEACAVLYSPYEPEPVVWPNREQAKKVVEEFRQLPEMDQHRKMFDHPAYLKQRVAKTAQQLSRLQRDNREREVVLAMHACLAGRSGVEGLSVVDLNDLGWMIDRSLKEVNVRLQALKRDNKKDGGDKKPANDGVPPPVEGPDPALPMPPPPMPLPGVFGGGEEVGPGMGQLLGLGLGNTNSEMQIQKIQNMGPAMWPMGQFFQMAAPGGFDGASGSGSDCGGAGDNVPPTSFGGFFQN